MNSAALDVDLEGALTDFFWTGYAIPSCSSVLDRTMFLSPFVSI
jgi:hypothetical protein